MSLWLISRHFLRRHNPVPHLYWSGRRYLLLGHMKWRTPVHSQLKQLQYQAWPLSTGGLRKYAPILGAWVRAVTHLLSSRLHMGLADSSSRKHRSIFVFSRCGLIVSIFSWSVLLVFSRDVCVFAMCSPCFYLFLFCVLLVFWRVYETHCSLTIEPNDDYCWEMSSFTLPVLPGPSRHQKFVSWRSREHPCVLAILAGLSLFVLVFSRCFLIVYIFSFVFSRCLRDAQFFHFLMNEHNKEL